MVRTALIWIFIFSLLICPLRCGKSLVAVEAGSVSTHQHCCSSCHHDIPTVPSDEDNHPIPDSGCGCLNCVCKGALVTSELQNLPAKGVAYPLEICWTLGQLPTTPPPSLVDPTLDWADPLRYGRGMRQSLQSWLI